MTALVPGQSQGMVEMGTFSCMQYAHVRSALPLAGMVFAS